MLHNSLLQTKPVIYSKTLGSNIIHLGAMSFRIPARLSYQLVVVDKDHVARPDLISNIMYNTDVYGDLICKLNGISNPFELNEGDVLILPGMDCIHDFYVTDAFDDTIPGAKDPSRGEDQDVVPIPKQRKEKRKPNEAVVGDTRFKVDKTRRLIIY